MGQENSNEQFNYERYTALARKEQNNGKLQGMSIQKKKYVIEKLDYPLKLANFDKNLQKLNPTKNPQISNIPKIMKKKPNFTKILKLNLDNDALISSTLNDKKVVYQNPRNTTDSNSISKKDISKDIDDTLVPTLFKCFECPKAISLTVNKENNTVQIICENQHKNELRIDSFISVKKIFKYICKKCKNELTNLNYCVQCKSIFCDKCLFELNASSIHDKNHCIVNEVEINSLCPTHRKRLSHFCLTCRKNICKKCTFMHNTHELVLIKNEIVDRNNVNQIKQLLNIEKKIISTIEEKFKNEPILSSYPKYESSLKKLINMRKLEYQLKYEILENYNQHLTTVESFAASNGHSVCVDLDSSLSSNQSASNEQNNMFLNYYFLKNVSEIENSVISDEKDFFTISQSNKNYNEFHELIEFLIGYKKNLITQEKNLDNFQITNTISKKPNFIFPLDDGNFIVTYDTTIVFYDGLYGDELLILDEEIFDYTQKIMQLSDGSLLFFGDYLNHILIDELGNINILFTGSHIGLLKGISLTENYIIFIDKLLSNLNVLTDRDINWHKEPFPELPSNESLDNSDIISEKNLMPRRTSNNDYLNTTNLSFYKDRNYTVDENLNASMATKTTHNFFNKRESFMKSINTIRKSRNIGKINKNNSKYYNKIKTYDIMRLNENSFIALQEKEKQSNGLCFRIFDMIENKIMENIDLVDEPLKKCDILVLIKYQENEKIIGFGLNNRKLFEIFDLDKKQIINKINLVFLNYKLFDDVLLCYHQGNLSEYLMKDNNLYYITKKNIYWNPHFIYFMEKRYLIIDDKKSTSLYTYELNKNNI